MTDRPFGANFIIAQLEDQHTPEGDKAEVRGQVEAAIDQRVSAVVLLWGSPRPFIKDAHRRDVRVLIQVGSVEEAEMAADAGVDAVIAQGVEAGGHVRGTTPIWELLPAVVDAVRPVHVLASSGSATEPGSPAHWNPARRAVSLGTRFVVSDEAWIHPAHKQRVVESPAGNTVHSELYDVW